MKIDVGELILCIGALAVLLTGVVIYLFIAGSSKED